MNLSKFEWYRITLILRINLPLKFNQWFPYQSEVIKIIIDNIIWPRYNNKIDKELSFLYNLQRNIFSTSIEKNSFCLMKN